MRNWFEIKNDAATKKSSVMIHSTIGKSWVGDDGIAAKDFIADFKTIPSDHDIDVHINSRGGNVWDGMAIYNALQGRKDQVTSHVDGVAASIASVIACAGKKTVMGKGSLMMTHPPSACPMDSLNASECRDLATKLDKHAEAIASVYAAKTGKSQKDCLDAMNAGETWMTANDACKQGFCDEISGDDTTAFLNEAKEFDYTPFKKVPENLTGKKTTQPNNTMDKTKIVALLKQLGVDIAADASEQVLMDALTAATKQKPVVTDPANVTALDALTAATKQKPVVTDPANVTALEARLTAITNQLEGERKTRVEAAVTALVGECRITAEEAPKAIIRAQADATYLDELRSRPQILPGGAPMNVGPAVYTTDDSVRNACNEILPGTRHRGERAYDTVRDRSQRVQAIWADRREKIIKVFNAAAANAIDPNLKRTFILQETVRDFATRVLPLRLFSTVFENVPLEGTDQVAIAYYPLQAAASQNFQDGDGTGGTGYQFGQNTNTLSRLITVEQRKYQPLDYSSNNFRRQPWFDAVRLGRINAEKLGVDCLLDVLSAFTPANYPTIPSTDPNFNPNLNMPSAGYTSDQVVDLKTVADMLNWPDGGRALITGTGIDNALSKDPAYKLALNIGTPDVTQLGKFPKLSGFDYSYMPAFPSNGINLTGLITFASCLGTAFAPIAPAPGVRAQLMAYDQPVDIATGIGFTYRHWGLAQADRDYEVVEAFYGYAPLVNHAAQLLTHP